MRTMCSREIFAKKCRQQQIFDSDFKGAWHYNHVTFTPIAKNFMLYCRLIYMLSILCVRLTIQVKVGMPESFKVGWYPPPPKKKKPGRVTLLKQSRKSNTYLYRRIHGNMVTLLSLYFSSKARGWPRGWQMPGPRAAQNLQMPHPRDSQGGQMSRSSPVCEGLGAAGVDWCITKFFTK